MTELTPEQAKARMQMKLKAKQKTETGGPASKSWWDNLKTEASGMASGLGQAALNPFGTMGALEDVAAGGLEAGARYLAPGAATKMDELGNLLSQMGLTDQVTPGQNSPGAQAATQMAKETYGSFNEPGKSFHDRPLSTGLDWLSLGTSGAGKIPGILKTAGGVMKAEDILKASKAAKDAAYADVATYGDKVGLTPLSNAALKAARDTGYNPKLRLYDRNTPAVNSIAKDFGSTGTLNDVRDMRKTASLVDMHPKVASPGLTADDAIAQHMREAIDSQLQIGDPKAFGILQAALEKNTKYKSTQEVLNLVSRGELSSKLSSSEAKAIGQDIRKTLNNPSKTKGLDETTVVDLKGILNHIKPVSAMGAVVDSTVSALPVGLGVAGMASPLGMLGYPVGHMAGDVIKHFATGAKSSKAAKAMTNDLLDIARELNGLPKPDMVKKLGTYNLSAKQRAAVLSTLGVPTQNYTGH